MRLRYVSSVSFTQHLAHHLLHFTFVSLTFQHTESAARSFVRSFVSLFGFCSLFIMCTYFHLHDFCLILKTIQFAKVVFHTSIRVLVPASS